MADVPRLTERQTALLIIVERYKEGITRDALAELMSESFPVSRATIIRDLNSLLEKDLLFTRGRGPSTLYVPRTAGELLLYYDLPMYFGYEPDERTLTTQSNDDFFNDLKRHHILLAEECTPLDEVNKQYQERRATREPDILKREQERFTIELAWKSSRIEGNTYSLLETEELLKSSKEAVGHTAEEAQMILNHKAALEMIAAQKGSFQQLSVDKVVTVHTALVHDLEICAGLREQPVGITGTNYTPPATRGEIEEYLTDAIEISNAKEHPLEAAIVISALIAYLQPFSDGNKRTARLIGNAVLIAHDYAPLSYRSVDEIVYKESVLLIDEQHSLYWYKRLFLEQFAFTCEKYFV